MWAFEESWPLARVSRHLTEATIGRLSFFVDIGSIELSVFTVTIRSSQRYRLVRCFVSVCLFWSVGGDSNICAAENQVEMKMA